MVQFRIQEDTVNSTKNVTGLMTTLNSSDGIKAGVTYIITVAANTVVGPGPPSIETRQQTIMQPLNISTGNQSITAATNDITETTIPIVLPSIPGATSTSFSHFWVIAMKVDNAFADIIQLDGTVQFRDNSSFTTYSDDIPLNTPYIVAEIAASNLTLSSNTNFILGNEGATAGLNDQPMYRNGPLTQGTQYTAFLWGFPPSVAVSLRYYYTATQLQFCLLFCLKLTKKLLVVI